MNEYAIPYGQGEMKFQLPEEWQVSILRPVPRKGLNNPVHEITAALEQFKMNLPSRIGDTTAAIAINDKTRPVPHNLLLPPLLEWLRLKGIKAKNITLIIATGTHTPMGREEHHLIVPENISRDYTIISHDAEDRKNLIDLGKTSRGTPCTINKTFFEADFRIVVGNIEPHQYMGWSGGVKSAVIGLGGAESIRTNHAMLSSSGAGPCRFEDNPVRMDVEESGRLIGVHLALNVVMNDSKEIVEVFAGKPMDVMRDGIKMAKSLFSVSIESDFDLIITSPGGFPKDINLYQSQKALRHGSLAAKHGAPIILAGSCSEGIGHAGYEQWMEDKQSRQQVLQIFKKEKFQLGPHKAMLFAADSEDRDVYIVSDLPEESVRKLLLTPAASIEEAIRIIIDSKKLKNPVKMAIIPYGNATVPYSAP